MTNHLLGSYFQVKSFLQDSVIDVTPVWHAIKIIKETKKNSTFKTCFYNFHLSQFAQMFFFPLKDTLDIVVTYLPLEYEDQVYWQRQCPHSLAEASLKKLLILKIYKHNSWLTWSDSINKQVFKFKTRNKSITHNFQHS